MSAVMNRRDQAGAALLFIVLAIGIGILIIVLIIISLRNPGGQPLSLAIRPIAITLIEDVPQTVQVDMALTHPLPAGLTLQFDVHIDEDDYWDDILFDNVTMTMNPGDPYAKATFQLVCNNLQPDGTFDLHAFPSGGKSLEEITHQINAEYDRTLGDLYSPNATVTCVVPPPETGDGTSGSEDSG